MSKLNSKLLSLFVEIKCVEVPVFEIILLYLKLRFLVLRFLVLRFLVVQYILIDNFTTEVPRHAKMPLEGPKGPPFVRIS